MKISKSKQELARIISENGWWCDGAKFSSQDKDGEVFHYATKPTINAGCEVWHHKGCIGVGEFTAETLPNWHQTILSREEYFHLNHAPDADGWIEWNGGECPVGKDDRIDVKFIDGDTCLNADSDWDWSHNIECKVIAYRLYKPEQSKPEFCESVMQSIPEPEINSKNINITQVDDIGVVESKPTIEQLASDYQAKLDIATRAQEEADAHRCGAEVALSKLEIAVKELGFRI